MEKKELENEAEKKCKLNDQIHRDCFVDGYIKAAEPREKRIAKLEEKISVLLSCKKCPENKGGLICQKEYENKCLAQKIQFIKELQEENAEQKEVIDNDVDKKIYVQLAKKAKLADVQKEQLTKAKEVIKKFSEFANNEVDYDPEHPQEYTDLWHKLCEEAEQFLEEIEK